LALWRLVLPLALLMLGWGVLVGRVFEHSGLNRPVLDTPAQTMVYAALLIAIFVVGLILSYNLAVVVYRATRGSPRVTLPAPERRVSVGGTLAQYRRIGLILAGGGAKGAYQAGAMRAIWEFLEEQGALERMCMVAGTSIGAWNALFWMAGLVGPPVTGDESAHEAWWRAVKPERILDFDWYVPLMRNHLARPTPWRETFRRIFVEHEPNRDQLVRLLAPRPDRPDRPAARRLPLHFYLTRSNVERALLEFTTNSWGVADLKRTDPRTGQPQPVVEPSLYQVLDGGDPSGALQELEDAVFASMDIPPLFPYVEMKDPIYGTDEWFEDGGVIENLPMLFGTQLEECDLLFVLPLNATFDAAANHHSILARLSRVMETRQGVIERNAFKQAYLYNDLHKLTGRPRVSVFAICPAEPLAVGTVDFHKAREAGAAYRLMYQETAKELREGFTQLTPDWIRLATVGPKGERKYIDEF
jgi:predicted acylesterase/phospholipase RssA